MKRRQVVALLGYLSLGGVAVFWPALKVFAQPAIAPASAEPTIAAVADLIFPATDCRDGNLRVNATLPSAGDRP